MIASSAALFAVLATIVAGDHFHVLPNPGTRDQAIAACANAGLQLAAITGASIEAVSAKLPANASGWIASWNGDNYQGACLQLKSGTITAAASCAEQNLPICEGAMNPKPHPVPSSSCDPSYPSSVSCESSTASWSCDSSSSFCCSTDLSSDICSSSFGESSSICDPCCAGVRKLTYQAPFGAGAYLAKVSQKFTVFDAFGTNACPNVLSLARTLGVGVTLVGSDGLDACVTAAGTEALTTAGTSATSADAGTYQTTYTTLAGLEDATLVAAETFQTEAVDLLEEALAAQLAASNAVLQSATADLVAAATTSVQVAAQIVALLQPGLTPADQTAANLLVDGLQAVVDAAEVAGDIILLNAPLAAAIPYGTFYVVSRAWALNQPIYTLLSGTVSAANSLFNCFGEYRAIYVSKPLSELSFVGNTSGNVCFDRCNGKPLSCLTLCNGLQRPGYLPKFKIGA